MTFYEELSAIVAGHRGAVVADELGQYGIKATYVCELKTGGRRFLRIGTLGVDVPRGGEAGDVTASIVASLAAGEA